MTTRVLDASSPSGQIVALAGIDGEITVEGVGPQVATAIDRSRRDMRSTGELSERMR